MSIPLKILTVNTHKGFTYFNRKFILPELRDAIRATAADLVFLQEVLGEHVAWSLRHKSDWPEQPQYEFLADSIWSSFAYGRNAVYPGGHHGNAVLSRYPIAKWKNHDISLNGIERRGLLYCMLEAGDDERPVHAICTHLSLREGHRQKQLDRLVALVNQLPADEPVIVAGDFNDWLQNSQARLKDESGLHEVFNDIYGKPARTFPAFCPLLRLDRIYVRSAEGHLPVVLPNRPWSHLSDHRPLFAEVTI